MALCRRPRAESILTWPSMPYVHRCKRHSHTFVPMATQGMVKRIFVHAQSPLHGKRPTFVENPTDFLELWRAAMGSWSGRRRVEG